jgi:4-azaleucine resistance transporter AzlC
MTASTPSPSGIPDTRQEFKRGLAAAVPVLIGLVPFALVLGAQAGQKQLSAAEVSLMAGLNFAGGSEFAAVQLWTSPPHLLLIAAVTLLVNSRHLVMGAAFAPLIRHLPRRKALALLFTLCDETWAMGLADADRAAARGAPRRLSLPYYIGVSSALWLAWVGLTALGAGVGPLLGDLQAYGFDLAFPAVVLVLLSGSWKGWRAARPWAVSLAVAAATHLLVEGAWFVMAGALAGLAAAWWWARPQ